MNYAAYWFLEALRLHDQRSSQIAGLIKPFIQIDGLLKKQLMQIFSWGIAHKSDEMSNIFLSLIKNGDFDDYKKDRSGDDFWGLLHSAESEAPCFVIDVLAAWLDRVLEKYDDGNTINFFDTCDQNRSHNGAVAICKAAAREPLYFVEKILPKVKYAILKTEFEGQDVVLNRAWPYLTNCDYAFDINDAVLLSLRKSMEHLAIHDSAELSKYAETISEFPHQTFGYLLISAWAKNPVCFADCCVLYFVLDRRRIDIGYTSVIGGGNEAGASGNSAISRLALRAVTSICKLELLMELEKIIMGYSDSYERRYPQFRGYTELLVLRSLEFSRISANTKSRIDELQRKFPNVSDAIVCVEYEAAMSVIESPISSEAIAKMSDNHWISAMRKYDGSSSSFARGDFQELSHVLAGCARDQKIRFANLAINMPQDILPIYFESILNGICNLYTNVDEDNIANTKLDQLSTDLLLDVINKLHNVPNRLCGSAILNCVQKIADRKLPSVVCEIVTHYAINDPDPDSDIWQQSVNGNKYYGGNPRDHGINTVRGKAALTIACLVKNDHSRIGALDFALSALSSDRTISVRTCAIYAFASMYSFFPDLAVFYFVRSCNECIDVIATNAFSRFVFRSMYSHYCDIRPLLCFALESSNSKAIQIASQNIVFAYIDGVDVGNDANKVCQGNVEMRKAAAHVLARNISHNRLGEICSDKLRCFFDDESLEVRSEVSEAFFNMTGERLIQLEKFIEEYINSKCFECENNYRLLQALQDSNLQLPQVVCRAAERVIDTLGENGSHVSRHGSHAANVTATLVVRQYEQTNDIDLKKRCLDLIDRMERLGFFGISGQLAKLER